MDCKDTARGGDSGSAYAHNSKAPCTDRYIAPALLEICAEYNRGGGKRVLDIGCGNGTLCRRLADSGYDVVGIEPSASGVANARAIVPEGVFYEMGVYDDPSGVAGKDFDIVVSTEVIEHLYQPAALLEFARAKLKADGLLVLSTPYHGYLKNLLIALFNKWDKHHSPWWHGGHVKFWSRKSLENYLGNNGFRVVGFRGVGRMPFLWKAMIIAARKA